MQISTLGCPQDGSVTQVLVQKKCLRYTQRLQHSVTWKELRSSFTFSKVSSIRSVVSVSEGKINGYLLNFNWIYATLFV